MTRSRVVVVGPHAERAGGIVTFHRNLMWYSDLSNNWSLLAYATDRPLKERTVANDNYGSILSSGLIYTLLAILVTLKNMVYFPFFLVFKRVCVAQIQAGDYYAFWEAICYSLISRCLGRHTVVRFGGSFDVFFASRSRFERWLIIQAMRIPSSIVCQSDGWKSYFVSNFNVSDVHVVNNAVLVPEYHGKPLNCAGKLNVLFICTVEAERKGLDLVLNAVSHFNGEVGFTFVAANQAVRDKVNELGLEDRIDLLPEIERDEMKILYQKTDLFILPSFSEGFPNSLLEAMSYGLPFVATRVGAVGEVVEDMQHGVLISPGSIQQLIAGIDLLNRDRRQMEKMGMFSRRLIESKYEVRKVFRRFNSIWARNE